MNALRSLVIADCAKYLRDHKARCASRLLLEADHRNLSAREWAELEADCDDLRDHARRDVAKAIHQLAFGSDEAVTLAAETLADCQGESVGTWATGVRRDVAHAAQGAR